MKKALCLLLMLMLPLSASASAEEYTDPLGALFEGGSTVFSMDLAKAALGFASQYSAADAEKIFSQAKFDIIAQERYDKPDSDISHTSAFTLASRTGLVGGKVRTLAVVSIRGTKGGEWYSNFDFAPSHNDDTRYAECFMLASMDIYVQIKPELDKMTDPVILVTGHSRGASCAGLLTTLLNSAYGMDNVFCYTFASPNTVRGEWDDTAYANIFNLVNPADCVVYLPLESMGYHRLGTDIILPGDEGQAGRVAESMAVFSGVADSINAFYTEKSPIGGGMSITAFELLQSLVPALSGSGMSKGFSAYSDPDGAFEVDPESRYAPVLALFAGLGQDQARAAQIGTQHMPNTYLSLMEKYAE